MRNVIFDVKSLASGSKPYECARRQQLQTSIRSAGGNILGIIHPLHYQNTLDKTYWVMAYPEDKYLQKKMTTANYEKFLGDFNSFVKRTTMPLFIFTEKEMRVKTIHWIGYLRLSSLAVLIDTEIGSPKPDIEKLNKPAWQWLVSLYRQMGVRQVKLVGESYFAEADTGCVAIARNGLKENGLNARILFGLTYPNGWIPIKE